MEEKLVLSSTQVNRYERNVDKDTKVSVLKPVHRSCSKTQNCVQRSQNPCNFEKMYYSVQVFRAHGQCKNSQVASQASAS